MKAQTAVLKKISSELDDIPKKLHEQHSLSIIRDGNVKKISHPQRSGYSPPESVEFRERSAESREWNGASARLVLYFGRSPVEKGIYFFRSGSIVPIIVRCARERFLTQDYYE